MRLLADRARTLAGADLVTVVRPGPDPALLQVEVASGVGAAELTGYAYPADTSMAALALSTGQPVLSPDVAADPRFVVHLTRALEVVREFDDVIEQIRTTIVSLRGSLGPQPA